jgi:RNA polymerase sigma-70 factor (ECF subfamily)
MSGTERGNHLRLVLTRPGPGDLLAEIASAAAAGDRSSVRALLLAVTPHLLRVVRKVLGAHHAEVDDVTQESAFAFLEALPGHRGECSVLHFACRVAVLTAMNTRRRDATQKRLRTRDDTVPVEGCASDAPAPEAEVIAQARAKAVRELLDTLPIEQAEVLAMHCVLGYTVREIADAAGTPVETVRSRLRLGKQALRARVADDPELRQIVGEEA